METAFLNALSDSDLLTRVQQLVHCERRTTAALVAHLAEFENRKLYLREACASMFVYCTRVLHFSEHVAYHRIAAARLARRFPAVLLELERGDVHVTALEMLAPHLTPENHRELLATAKHKSKRQILELIASVHPKPDVAAAVRKVPANPAPVPAPTTEAPGQEPGARAAAASDTSQKPNSTSVDNGLFVLAPRSEARKAEIVPLAPERYKIQFTASADTCNKLRRAQELLRHRIPNGDVAAVVDQALDLLVRELERQKFAATNRPRRPTTNGAAVQNARSRHIPAEVKRIVWQRDHGRCTFVSPDGARCNERGGLEFDHIQPYGDGGDASAGNIRLLCRAHNQYEAGQFFGVWQASTG
jgi:5-methylcytosine-specific restriction endonuclease McrA